MISLKDFFLYFSICVSLPSFILYILEVWTIICDKSLHNPFYTLFCVRAFFGLVYVFDSYYGFRIPNLFPYWFSANPFPEWTLSLFIFMTNCSLLGDNLGTVCVMLNRLTAIAWPLKHELIWNKIILIVCLVCFALPLNGIGSLTIRFSYLIQRDEKNESIVSIDVVETKQDGRLNFYIQLSTIESIFFLIAFIIINLMTIFAYKKRLNSQTGVVIAHGNKSNDKIERKLMFFALLTSFGQMLIAIIVICIYAASIWNMISFKPSFLLPWASQSFRIKLIRTILPEKLHKSIIGSIKQSTKIIKNQTTIKVLPANSIKIK
uniref:Serpentine receptor class gamma n=1 Tax=Meloidogyne enterolobii TaxID=390850 RepID=A0A6V7W3L9_MELEN|nr:unnamed protein product [Meloidogyne enterolobii]